MADYVIGSPAFFNEDGKFFKDVYVYGTLYYDFESFPGIIKFGDIDVNGIANFFGPANFYNDVNFDNLQVGIITVTKRIDVGIGGTILTTSTGNVGIGSAIPQQKLDVTGSVKIDSQIYDSLNNAGNIGAFLTKDAQGIKWTDFEPAFTEGIFVYNENVLVGVQSFRGLNLSGSENAVKS